MMITTYTRWFLSKQWQRSVWWWCLSKCPGGRSCTEKPCEGEAGGGGVQAQDEGDWWWRSCYKCNVSSKKLPRCWSSWWECSKRKAKEGNKSCLRTSLWRWGCLSSRLQCWKKRRRLRRSTSSAMFSERCKALEDFLLELKRSVDFTRIMMVMLTQDDKDDDKNDWWRCRMSLVQARRFVGRRRVERRSRPRRRTGSSHRWWSSSWGRWWLHCFFFFNIKLQCIYLRFWQTKE